MRSHQQVMVNYQLVAHLGRRKNRKSGEHSIRILLSVVLDWSVSGRKARIRNDLSDFRQQERTKASTGTTSERVCELEALQSIAGLRLLLQAFLDRIDQLCTLRINYASPS